MTTAIIFDPERLLRAYALGAWVRASREIAGISQGELARSAGFSQSWLSKIEAGFVIPDAYRFGKLISALRTTPDGADAAIRRVEAATLRAARALVDKPLGWDQLLPRLGETSVAALALAAARVWLPG